MVDSTSEPGSFCMVDEKEKEKGNENGGRMLVKVIRGGLGYRLWITDSPTYESVADAVDSTEQRGAGIEEQYGPPAVITYQDDDGDRCRLTESTFEDALTFAKRAGRFVLWADAPQSEREVRDEQKKAWEEAWGCRKMKWLKMQAELKKMYEAGYAAGLAAAAKGPEQPAEATGDEAVSEGASDRATAGAFEPQRPGGNAPTTTGGPAAKEAAPDDQAPCKGLKGWGKGKGFCGFGWGGEWEHGKGWGKGAHKGWMMPPPCHRWDLEKGKSKGKGKLISADFHESGFVLHVPRAAQEHADAALRSLIQEQHLPSPQ